MKEKEKKSFGAKQYKVTRRGKGRVQAKENEREALAIHTKLVKDDKPQSPELLPIPILASKSSPPAQQTPPPTTKVEIEKETQAVNANSKTPPLVDNPPLDKKKPDFKGHVVSISGAFKSYTRKELTKLIQKHGGRVVDGITSEVTHLLTDDMNSTTSKMKQAKENGVKIVGEEFFNDLE